MKYVSSVLFVTILIISLQSIAYSQDSCMPVSYPIKDIVIKFNLQGCDRYQIEPDHSTGYQLLYKNNTPDIKIVVKREPDSKEYAINYGMWMLLLNYSRKEPTNVGIDGCTGSMMIGSSNNENGKTKIVLKYPPRNLGSDDYICTIETTIDKREFDKIVDSFKIEMP